MRPAWQRKLTWQDAFAIGERRWAAAEARGAKHRDGYDPTPEVAKHWHAMSAVSEWKVSVAVDEEWLSTGDVPDDPDKGDVAGGWAVRWTRLPWGKLILQPPPFDRPHLKGVLVRGPDPAALEIRGWIPVAAGQSPIWWWEDAPTKAAYFVPPGIPGWHDDLPPPGQGRLW